MSNDLAIRPDDTGLILPRDALARMQLCDKLAMARLVPQAFARSGPDIFLVMEFCERRGLDFFTTIQECSVIKGKLFLSGKLSAAILNASPALATRLFYNYSGEGDDRMVIVSARLKDETEPRTVEVRLRDVRTENEVWRRQVDQQLSYAGARIWGRRHVPDVMLGLLFEGEKIVDVTPTVIDRPANDNKPREDMQQEARPAFAQPTEPPAHDPETGETGPRVLPVPGDSAGWRGWCQKFIAYIHAERDIDMVDEWIVRNEGALLHLRDNEQKMYRHLEHLIEQHKLQISSEPEPPTIIGAG